MEWYGLLLIVVEHYNNMRNIELLRWKPWVSCVKHFWHYLYGHHCHVFTDHEPLKSLSTISQESITMDGESSSSLSPVLSELEKSSVGKK